MTPRCSGGRVHHQRADDLVLEVAAITHYREQLPERVQSLLDRRAHAIRARPPRGMTASGHVV